MIPPGLSSLRKHDGFDVRKEKKDSISAPKIEVSHRQRVIIEFLSACDDAACIIALL